MSSSTAHRPFIVAAVMASMAMVAIEATIVSTAMPQIVAELGGLNLYSWVFSSFLLAQTAMTVVFGKLGDVFGRKPMMLAGIAIFLVGSILAGFAWSMASMIVFRLIQGVGAAAIQPLALTIVGDHYPAAERGKVQGYLASVWAISAVIGPMVGGVLIHSLSWSWIFWINVPIGLGAAAGFIAYLRDETPHKRQAIDILGAVLFTIAIAALMISLTDGPSLSASGLETYLIVFALATVLFVLHERRVADPMISFELWGRRSIAATNAGTLLAGMALIGLTTFLPMYSQGVLHQSPVAAGLTLTVIMVGWPTGATLAARNFTRFGLRRVMVGGSAFVPLGAAVLVFLQPDSSPLLAAAGSLVMGLGMGLSSVTSMILIQEVAAHHQRASVTASNMFARNLGSTLGAALFGAVLNYGLSNAPGGAVTSDQLKQVLDTRGAEASRTGILDVLQHSLHWTFIAVVAVSVLMVALLALVPRSASQIGRKAAVPGPSLPH